MKFTDLLTIAMPCYERKEFFLNALESALNQTVKCEIIVIDNCSSHNYFQQICSEKEVTYFRNETNIGLFRNWNKCFELANTEYVMILGDDDLLSPHYVESFVDALEKYPNLDIFYSNFIINNLKTSNLTPHKHQLPFGYMENGNTVIEYGIKYNLGFPVITSAIKKSKFTAFYTDFHASNDWLWLYSNADKLSFYGDSRALYKYGVHGAQDSFKTRLNCNFSLSYIYDEILKNKVTNENEKKLAINNTFWVLFMIKGLTDQKIINEWMQTDNLYGNYLKRKMNSDRSIKTLFLLPKGLIYIIYKTMSKYELIMNHTRKFKHNIDEQNKIMINFY